MVERLLDWYNFALTLERDCRFVFLVCGMKKRRRERKRKRDAHNIQTPCQFLEDGTSSAVTVPLDMMN